MIPGIHCAVIEGAPADEVLAVRHDRFGEQRVVLACRWSGRLRAPAGVIVMRARILTLFHLALANPHVPAACRSYRLQAARTMADFRRWAEGN